MRIFEVVDGVLILLALLVLLVFGMASRRRWLQRGGGTFDCSLREPRRGTRSVGYGKGWVLGVARYDGDQLHWFRVFSVSPRPRHSLPRRAVAVRGRRVPRGPESFALLSGAVVVELDVAGRPLELGMGPDELTGLLAWLESAPPGQGFSVA